MRIFAVLGMILCLGLPGRVAGQHTDAMSDAFLHIVAHEIGHAVLREFDVPILGPEEALADDFATLYIHALLPDRAEAIVSARARQFLADGDQPDMFSEYMSDAQRAGRSVCVLYGQDPERYETLARTFGLDGDAAAACRDFGPEIGRSWRRVLHPFWMPANARVTEVRVSAAETEIGAMLRDSGALDTAYDLLSAVDWHSLITLSVQECDGSAWWARNGRRITVCESYLNRISQQLH